MDHDFSQEQQDLRTRVDELCRAHCGPEAAAALDREPSFPDALHRALGAQGVLGRCLPKPYGEGGGMVDLAIISEVLGRYSDPAVNLFFIHLAAGTLIGLGGTGEQKNEHLPPLAAGERRFAFALTEPGAGSDAASITCRATKVEGGYRVAGTKLFTTGASVAHRILAIVRTNDEPRAQGGTSILAIPTDADGLTITAMDKIAGRALPSCEVVFDDVFVAESDRLGPENGAWGLLTMTAGIERLVVAASAVGAAATITDEAAHYAKERRQFGQPIARFQSIQHRLVDMATKTEAMRWLTYHAAWLADTGRPCVKEIGMAKLFCSEALPGLALDGMKILGGRAYLRGHAMERHLRESLLGLYAGGTPEIQRRIIGKQLGLA